MKVLQATCSNRSFPPDAGGYQRTHGLVMSFPALGSQVDRYCCAGPIASYYRDREIHSTEIHPQDGITEYRDYRVVYDLPKAGSFLGLGGVLWGALLPWISSAKLKNSANQADIVLGDDPYMAKFLAEAVDTPVIYTSHNVEYERYRTSTDAIYSSYTGSKMKEIEEEAVKKSTAVVCTTEDDKEEYEPLNDDLFVIPNGIDKYKITSKTDTHSREEFGIPKDVTLSVFLGSDYAPNVEAAEWLCENWSELDESYHLLIIGNVGSRVQPSDPRIHTIGFVEDLMSALSLGDMAINPVISGGGSNVKIMDYFAADLPVVSTEFGVQGFDVSHKSEALVGDRGKILDYITEISENENLRRKLSENVISKREEYTWQSLSEELHTKLRRYL
ncbi:hypothetical protein HTG_00975 [Natrinema mahii]|nr:hypothetical protein HTG_00975 [Natrinema mahii]